MDPKNKAQIQSNRRKIFELEILINSNKTKVEVCRASIEQNYASIMRNYNAAYMGNHHLACLLYTSPSPRDLYRSRMPSSA